jgi:hypothetical protein
MEKREMILQAIAREYLGDVGKMVGASKSIYTYDNPSNIVIFNANLATKEDGKFWYGDIDLTLSMDSLIDTAKDIGKDVYVLYEMDARFENEDNPKLDKAVLVVSPKGQLKWSESMDKIVVKSGDKYTLNLLDEKEESPAPKQVLNKSDYKEIDLPAISEIKATLKEDPLSSLQHYFIDKFGREEAEEVYRNLYVTKSYMDKLEEKVEKWANKKLKGYHPVKIKQSIAWYMLDMSPSNFQSEQEWENPNKGYIKKK